VISWECYSMRTDDIGVEQESRLTKLKTNPYVARKTINYMYKNSLE